MKRDGYDTSDYDMFLKSTATDTTPVNVKGKVAFYVVAYGRRPGIYPYYQ